MKKWVAVPVCLLVLTACGNESDNSSQTATEANESESDKEHAITEDENSSEDLEKPEENEVEEQDSEPLYEINSNSWTVEPIEGTDANEKVVLLTIDDAPDAYGLEMAQTLEELDVPAIFFVNGHFIEDEEGAE